MSIPHPLPGCWKTDESILQTIFFYTWTWSRISYLSYFALCYIVPTVEAPLYLHQFKWNQNAPLWRQCQLRQELTQKIITVTILTKCLSKLVSVLKFRNCLKACSLPHYFYIKVLILHPIHFSHMHATLSWKQGIILLLGNEYNGCLSNHLQVCTHENLKSHTMSFIWGKVITTTELFTSSFSG